MPPEASRQHNQGMTRSSRPIPAQVRILAAILAVACVGLAIVGSVTFLVQRERVLSEVDQRLKMQVESLQTVASAASSPAVDDVGAATASETLDIDRYDSVAEYLHDAVARLVPGRNEASVAIIDGIARYKPATLSGFDISDDEGFIERAVLDTADGETALGTASTDDGSLRYIAIPVQMEKGGQSGVYVRAVNLGAELEPVTAAMATYVLAALIVLVAIGFVGWFVTGRLLSPIRLMRETADAISITDLSPRLSTQGNDDISDLSRTVNSMLDRIEGSVDVQRQLLDDVRHELKTPITIVRGHLELMDPRDAGDAASAR
jgi:two-component system OmpR family sensor kinase